MSIHLFDRKLIYISVSRVESGPPCTKCLLDTSWNKGSIEVLEACSLDKEQTGRLIEYLDFPSPRIQWFFFFIKKTTFRSMDFWNKKINLRSTHLKMNKDSNFNACDPLSEPKRWIKKEKKGKKHTHTTL